MRLLDTSGTKAGRKTHKSTASALGLAAGAIGWSGLAQAASEESGPQTLLLPDHYHLSDDGLVTFRLQTGEQLTLNPDQYVLLQDGLLLIADEMVQASMQSLPVMGSIRAQLTSELEPVRSPDGSVVQASDASPLWSGDGLAPRLFEEVDIQRYELAQNEQESSPEINTAAMPSVAASGLLAGLGLISGVFATSASEDEDIAEGGGTTTTPPVLGEFLTDAQFQLLTPTAHPVFTGSALNSYIGYSDASTSSPDPLNAAQSSKSATFDMSAGGDNYLALAQSAAAYGGLFSYVGGSGDDTIIGDDLAFFGSDVTIDMTAGGNNSVTGADSVGANGTLEYLGGTGQDSLTFGSQLATGNSTVTLKLGVDNSVDTVQLSDTFFDFSAPADLKIMDFGADDVLFVDGWSSATLSQSGTDVQVLKGGEPSQGFTLSFQTVGGLSTVAISGGVYIEAA